MLCPGAAGLNDCKVGLPVSIEVTDSDPNGSRDAEALRLLKCTVAVAEKYAYFAGQVIRYCQVEVAAAGKIRRDNPPWSLASRVVNGTFELAGPPCLADIETPSREIKSQTIFSQGEPPELKTTASPPSLFCHGKRVNVKGFARIFGAEESRV